MLPRRCRPSPPNRARRRGLAPFRSRRPRRARARAWDRDALSGRGTQNATLRRALPATRRTSASRRAAARSPSAATSSARCSSFSSRRAPLFFLCFRQKKNDTTRSSSPRRRAGSLVPSGSELEDERLVRHGEHLVVVASAGVLSVPSRSELETSATHRRRPLRAVRDGGARLCRRAIAVHGRRGVSRAVVRAPDDGSHARWWSHVVAALRCRCAGRRGAAWSGRDDVDVSGAVVGRLLRSSRRSRRASSQWTRRSRSRTVASTRSRT